jgi:Family of unknown function (DUF6338)
VSGWTAWAYALVSVTLAALAAAALPGANSAGQIHPESGWVTAFDRIPRLAREAQHLVTTPIVRASVRLTDGTVYVGDVAEYSAGLPLADRELVLDGELLSRHPNAATAEPLAEWQRVLLRGDQISDIAVQYIPGTAPSATQESKSLLLEWLRRGTAAVLGRSSESTWRQLLEASAVHAGAAGRLLLIELSVLFIVAVVSRFV